MGFDALASLVAHRPGLGLQIVVIRIVVIRIGRVLIRTERITILLRSDNLETRYLSNSKISKRCLFS